MGTMSSRDRKLKDLLQSREYILLVGKNKLILLVVILLSTLISLGHVIEGLRVLETSMKNPFTNWVDVSNRFEDGTNLLIRDIESYKDSFHITNIIGYHRPKHEIVKRDFTSELIKNRSLSINDPLVSMIFSDENLIHSFVDKEIILKEFNDCGIVVSEKFVNRIGYSNPLDVNEIVYSYQYLPNTGEDYDTYFKIPVVCIVKELPNNVDFVAEDKFFKLYRANNILIDESISSSYVRVLIDPRFDIASINDVRIEELIFQDEVLIYDKLYNYYEILLKNQLDKVARAEFRKELITKYSDIISFDELSCGELNSRDELSVDYYAYNFNSLENIKDFSKFALTEYGIEIPIKQVESKQNFFIVSRIAFLFVFILVIGCIFSIVLFLNNILRNHLEFIKPNLGTLKAFGMADRSIQMIYYKIIIKFFLIGSIIAFTIACIYHFIFNNLDVKGWYFNIYDLKILFIWLAILMSLIVFFYYSINKVLAKTAGDLIYNR